MSCVVFLIMAAVAIAGCGRSAPSEVAGALWLDLSKVGTPHLESLETGRVEFGSESSHALLGAGWRDDDDKQLIQHQDVLWAASIVAELRLIVLRPRDLTLTFEMQQHFLKPVGDTQYPPQQVDIVWNKVQVGSCQFTKEDSWNFKQFSFAIPQAAQVPGINVVTFCSRYAVSARQIYGEGNDGRSHAFGLKTLDLREQGAASRTAGSRAVEFRDGDIRQYPGSRLTIPVHFAASGAGAFVLQGIAPGEPLPSDLRNWSCRLLFREDSVAGPIEKEIAAWGRNEKPPGEIRFPLDNYADKYGEFVFEVDGADSGASVLWQAPRILWRNAPDIPQEPQPPALAPCANVVLIVLDALRSDSVGDNGHYRRVTPAIDSLAESGVLFTRAYAGIPYTYGSTWCLETGLYAFQHGALGSNQAPSAPKLCEVLKRSGIMTGLVSANPLASHPEGFDEFVTTYEDLLAQPGGNPGLATDKAVDYMHRHAGNRFFLHVHYRQPHAPYQAPAEDFKQLTYDTAGRLSSLNKIWKEIEDERTRIPTPEQALEIRARYDENTHAADRNVARIVEELKALGLDDKTLVIVTSDHGEGFGEHENTYSHTVTVYEPVMHVPLVLHGAGMRDLFGPCVETVVSNIDIFPTVCAAMGVPIPETIAGTSLLTKATRDTRQSEPILAFGQGAWRNRGALNIATNHWGEAYWWQRYKLIHDNNNARVEVYDLSCDAAERGNMAMAFPMMTDYLLAQADAWKSAQDVKVTQPVPCKDSESRVNRDFLKALGYL